jgi:hypothetical protein
MADSIKADPSITGSSGTGTPGTYKGFDGKSYKLDLQSAMGVNSYDTTLANNRALRNYTENQAKTKLQEALGTMQAPGLIDRTALEAYKGVANNYAARGMQRSGGYFAADNKVLADANQAKIDEMNKYKSLTETNQLTDTADQQTRNQGIWDLIQQFINTDAGKKLNQIGSK